jgi:Ecdysteroid kinase-like family
MKDNEILRIVQCCLPNIMITTTTTVDTIFSVDDYVDDPHSNKINENNIVFDINDVHVQSLCSLWAGMGHIYKVTIPYPLKQQEIQTTKSTQPRQATTFTTTPTANSITVILKHIVLPTSISSSQQQSISNQRKIDSYYVETNFYEKLAPKLISKYNVSIPIPYYVERPSLMHPNQTQQNKKTNKQRPKQEIIIAMSYIDIDRTNNYSKRQRRDAVLTWLANFHYIFWSTELADDAVRIYGLQPEGSYWYLNTRHEEHSQMSNHGWIGRLKMAARAIADYLQHRDIYQCIIHGDAKEANILYTKTATNVCIASCCDFQYCGKASFTKDLVYYLLDDFDEHNNDDNEINDAIEFYLQQLSKRLPSSVTIPTLGDINVSLSFAWCDWYRFMIGWGGWGIKSSTSKSSVTRILTVLDRLDNGINLGSEEAYDQAIRREFG